MPPTKRNDRIEISFEKFWRLLREKKDLDRIYMLIGGWEPDSKRWISKQEAYDFLLRCTIQITPALKSRYEKQAKELEEKMRGVCK